jgi:catechol 2,3-dioxygenase-like lactoylglutathione lyase family enzyme
MIDHITIAASDLEKSKLFYERAFEPLGYRLSFGKENVFWAFDVGGSLFEIQHTDDKPPLTRARCLPGPKQGGDRGVLSRRARSRREG